MSEDPGKLAREAMERARQSAKQRGAARSSSPRGARKGEATQPFQSGRDPLAMSAAVDHLMRRMGWVDQLEVAAVTARWREIVGDKIADHATPIEFNDGALVVQTSSTAWSTQLTLMEGQIIHTINEQIGAAVVTTLKVVGPTARTWTKGQRRVPGRGPRDTYG